MKNTIVVEVEGFEGEAGSITVSNDRAASGLGRDDPSVRHVLRASGYRGIGDRIERHGTSSPSL